MWVTWPTSWHASSADRIRRMSADYYARLAWRPLAPADFRSRVQAGGDDRVWRALAQYALTEPQLHALGRAFLKRDPARSNGLLTPLKLAVLSNGTAEHLVPALVASGLRYGLALEVLVLAYEAAFLAALGGDARLTTFGADVVLVAEDHRGLPLPLVSPAADDHRAADAVTAHVQAWADGIRRHTGATCLMQTYAAPLTERFGHADARLAGTARQLIAVANQAVLTHADAMVDVASLVQTVGSAAWFDERRYHESKLPFAIPFVPLYADHIARVLGALRGKSRRVLVLDLDNTLWGGVVGDDGVEGIVIGNGTARGEAHLALQRHAVALRHRGILLAVSSKNDEAVARRAFAERPEMLLDESAFAAFRANWSDKAANLQAISEELALGLDSFVFLDDNPAERELVRTLLPEVAVPEVGDDPSDFVRALDAGGWFEAVRFSDEDRRRADLYTSRRAMSSLAPSDLGSYLASLEMELEIAAPEPANRERVTQLINKSNQFNLTTRRYSEAEVAALEGDPTRPGLVLRLRDRLDDHGIISIILTERAGTTLDIVLWVMSCRVIGRGVERAAVQSLLDLASALECTQLRGRYLPTPRNGMVREHYAALGFTCVDTAPDGATTWTMALPAAAANGEAPIRRVWRDQPPS